MKALCLILALVAGDAWAVYAPNTTGLYDIEQNLSDTAGTAHGTELRAMTYQTTGAWHGTYCGGGNGQFSIPAAVLPSAAGTVEFSIRTGASIPNSSDWIVIGYTGQSRALELFNSASSIGIFSVPFSINSAVYALSTNTNYYLKLTWDAGNIKLYGGSWTTAGSVTLVEKYSTTGTFTGLNSINSITFMRNPVLPSDPSYYNPGFVDWIRTRNVYDPTTTVTTDPANAASQPLSPYMWNTQTNKKIPAWFLK